MPSKGISVNWWLDEYPVLLETLAERDPGMTPYDVAEILDDMDWELTAELNAEGECMDLSDGALIVQYLYAVA